MGNNVTLVMTRQPLTEFLWLGDHYEEIDDEAERTHYFGVKDPSTGKRVGVDKKARGAKSGQWGVMAVVEGPLVTAASRVTLTGVLDLMKSLVQHPMSPNAKPQVETITLAGRNVSLVTDGSAPLKKLAEFDTMERYRTDSNKNAWYVRLPPQPFKPYPLELFQADLVAKFHERMKVRRGQGGKCLRVREHGVKQQNGAMAGILLHEATNPSWLTGCISPRTKNHRQLSSDIKPCVDALDVVYKAMGTARRAHLFIVD
jgi:hypothetical protein